MEADQEDWCAGVDGTWLADGRLPKYLWEEGNKWMDSSAKALQAVLATPWPQLHHLLLIMFITKEMNDLHQSVHQIRSPSRYADSVWVLLSPLCIRNPRTLVVGTQSALEVIAQLCKWHLGEQQAASMGIISTDAWTWPPSLPFIR